LPFQTCPGPQPWPPVLPLQAACWIIGVAFFICAWNPAEPGDIVCELAEYAVAITSAAAKNAIANFCTLISDSMQEGEFTLSAGPNSINVIVAFDCYPIVIELLSGRWRTKCTGATP
jgi:hypothetical protein